MLLFEYGSYENMPEILRGAKIVELEEHQQSMDIRKKFQALSFLPLRSSFKFVEVDMKSYVSNETLEEFRYIITKRASRRKHLKTKQLHDRQQMQKQTPAFSEQYMSSVAALSRTQAQQQITLEKLQSHEEFPEPRAVAMLEVQQNSNSQFSTHFDNTNSNPNNNLQKKNQNNNGGLNKSGGAGGGSLLPPAPVIPEKKKGKKQQQQTQQNEDDSDNTNISNNNTNSPILSAWGSQQNQRQNSNQQQQQQRSFVDVIKSNKKPSSGPALLSDVVSTKTPFKKTAKGKEYILFQSGGVKKK